MHTASSNIHFLFIFKHNNPFLLPGAHPVCPAGDAVRGAAHQQSGHDGVRRRGGQTGEWRRRGRGLLWILQGNPRGHGAPGVSVRALISRIAENGVWMVDVVYFGCFTVIFTLMNLLMLWDESFIQSVFFDLAAVVPNEL